MCAQLNSSCSPALPVAVLAILALLFSHGVLCCACAVQVAKYNDKLDDYDLLNA